MISAWFIIPVLMAGAMIGMIIAAIMYSSSHGGDDK